MTFSKSRILSAAVLVLRVILAGVFIYAGYVKVREPWQLFAAGIAGYDLVPMSTVEFLAKTFPWFEIAARNWTVDRAAPAAPGLRPNRCCCWHSST